MWKKLYHQHSLRLFNFRSSMVNLTDHNSRVAPPPPNLQQQPTQQQQQQTQHQHHNSKLPLASSSSSNSSSGTSLGVLGTTTQPSFVTLCESDRRMRHSSVPQTHKSSGAMAHVSHTVRKLIHRRSYVWPTNFYEVLFLKSC